MMLLHFLHQFALILKSYFKDGNLCEATVRHDFSLIYELLDEVMDLGHPQLSDPDLLKEYIRTGKQAKQLTDIEKLKAITVRATGAVSWRAEGLSYKKNEIYIDIIESVNVLLSNRGTVLKADVLGKIVVKTQLSGMPECKFGVNDRLLMSQNDQPDKIDKGIQIDDIKFHQCVRLGKFDRDRSITFIPPDGTFDIMTYRISENINLPFKIVPVIQEYPELCKIEISVRIKAIFEASNFATGVICYIPVPQNTANVRIFSSGSGKARYEPENKSCIVWRFLRFQGDSESLLTADVQLIPSKTGKAWVKPPISLEFQVSDSRVIIFQVPMFTGSGLRVRFCRIQEKSGYKPIKWIRYLSKSGDYQHKI